MKINIFGIDVGNYSSDEVIKMILDRAVAGVATEYAIIPNNRRQISSLKTQKNSRIGIELLAYLFTEAAARGLKIFFLGDNSSATRLITTKLQQQHPQLQVSFYCPISGFATNSLESVKIADTIHNAAPDLLLVRVSTPQQEKWLEANYQQLRVPICLSISSSFKLIAEALQDTPPWIRQTGLEWLYKRLIDR
jgi:N-acetylglucosaminyldiphosphoundecaprenol N-acetyl-beta-D-mannosaminyltransferase